jgi:hypothetical protein
VDRFIPRNDQQHNRVREMIKHRSFPNGRCVVLRQNGFQSVRAERAQHNARKPD